MPIMNSVIDADGHVFEIDESWETYADPAYGDRWPRLITDSSGGKFIFWKADIRIPVARLVHRRGLSPLAYAKEHQILARVCKTWRFKAYTSLHSFQDSPCELAGG
jgi:hypothetical protein